MAIGIECEKPKFYFEPYVDIKNRVRTKIVCIKKINLGLESGETKTHYMYGSAAHSPMDEYRQETGEKIAMQRTDKLNYYFTYANFNVEELLAKKGDLLTKHKLHMRLLNPEEFSELEKKLLPFREPPKQVPAEMPAEVAKN